MQCCRKLRARRVISLPPGFIRKSRKRYIFQNKPYKYYVYSIKTRSSDLPMVLNKKSECGDNLGQGLLLVSPLNLILYKNLLNSAQVF